MNSAATRFCDYAEARADLVALCAERGLELESHRHPGSGPLGEALYTDVARAGSPHAGDVIMLCSGTHGIEGLCGSALQRRLIRDGLASRLGPDQRLVLVHALNPWGFAHLRRVNEDNIDLNRNFLDHSRPKPRNLEYDALADAFAPATYLGLISVSRLRLALYRLTRGQAALQAALTRGQYHHRLGLFYGGTGACWSNRTFRAIVDRHARGAARLVFIDFHTGLGPFGHAEIITASAPDACEYRRAVAWWGDRVKTTRTGEAVGADLVGPIRQAFSACPATTGITAISLEFGTLSPVAVLRALQAENWQYHHGGENRRAARIRARFRRAFCPDDDRWRALAWEQAVRVVDEAVAGLARSSPAAAAQARVGDDLE
jgi:predicted deacylase